MAGRRGSRRNEGGLQAAVLVCANVNLVHTTHSPFCFRSPQIQGEIATEMVVPVESPLKG